MMHRVGNGLTAYLYFLNDVKLQKQKQQVSWLSRSGAIEGHPVSTFQPITLK